MSADEPRLRIAICGGGVGGLTLAYALARLPNVRTDVYEAAARFAEIGAGLVLPARTRRVFAALDLADEIRALAPPRPASAADLELWRADSGTLEHAYNKIPSPGGPVVSVHRAEFHGMLLRQLPAHTQTHAGKRLVSYTQHSEGPIELSFADGSTATCDVLVGADGVKSAVRATMFESLAARADNEGEAEKLRAAVKPRYSGMTSFRTTYPREKLAGVAPEHGIIQDKAHKMYVGKNNLIIAFPMQQGKIINVGLSIMDFSLEDTLHPEPWASSGSADQINAPKYEDWAEEARQIIQCMEGCEIKRWVINTVPPLPTFDDGRVILLGDAAHAMTPYLGAGAGQAVEDAYFLASLLADERITRKNVTLALRAYSAARVPITTGVQADSARLGRIYGQNIELTKEEFGREVQRLFDGLDSYDPIENAEKVVKELEEKLGAQ